MFKDVDWAIFKGIRVLSTRSAKLDVDMTWVSFEKLRHTKIGEFGFVYGVRSIGDYYTSGQTRLIGLVFSAYCHCHCPRYV